MGTTDVSADRRTALADVDTGRSRGSASESIDSRCDIDGEITHRESMVASHVGVMIERGNAIIHASHPVRIQRSIPGVETELAHGCGKVMTMNYHPEGTFDGSKVSDCMEGPTNLLWVVYPIRRKGHSFPHSCVHYFRGRSSPRSSIAALTRIAKPDTKETLSLALSDLLTISRNRLCVISPW